MASTLLPPRKSSEFKRSYVPDSADLGEWSRIEPILQDLCSRPLSTQEELERWLADLSEAQACIEEEESRRAILYTCQTDDPEREKAHLQFIEEITPQLKPCWDRMNRQFLDSPARTGLDPLRYEVYQRLIENEAQLFRAENVPLQTEDDKLRQQYEKVCGAMTVQFQGEEKTFPQMKKYQEETDRAVRQEAWEKVARRALEDADALNEIYDQQVRLRTQMAHHAGFANYRDYQHLARGRFDYTPSDCVDFQDAVEKEVVPLMQQLAERRRRQMGLDRLRPWDMQVDPQGRPPLRPFDQARRLIDGCIHVFSRVCEEFGQQFRTLDQNGLLDLESRKGKAPGGYQAFLSEIRLPFIFMNAAGTDDDLFTLLHEGGHAFHSFAARFEPLQAYRSAPLEFCEVASMGMELLCTPYLEEFYTEDEAQRSRISHLEDILMILPWIATIDAFQHWVYLHPEHTRKEREDYWLELRRRFGPPVDWSGYEDCARVAWHRQLHLFTHPFYYIEYGIAQLGSLQLWLNASQDRARAVQDYRKGLALGGSRPLPVLFETSGLRFGFNREVVAPLAARLAQDLELG